jgi:hypothetical protein
MTFWLSIAFVALLALPWFLIGVDVIAHALRKWPLAVLAVLWAISIVVLRKILPEYVLISVIGGFAFSAVTCRLLIYADRTWRQVESWRL